jgi:outer membrane immunogenic protein
MGFRRALALAILAMWGLGTQAVPARADGAAVPPDDYSPYAPSGFFVFDWSGFYAGGSLGAAFTNAESTEIIFPDSLEFFQSLNYDQSETSVTGGVHAGWQRQWGKLVAGAEIGFSLLQFDTTKESPLLSEFVGIVNLQRSVELRDIFTLTGRLGYAEERWLAYAKGGLATAEVDVSYRETITGATTSSSGREVGWTAGLGIDYALTQNWVLGIEYNYLHFRTDIQPPPIAFPPTQTGDVDVDTQTLVVRLNYRFGPCCGGPAGYGRP